MLRVRNLNKRFNGIKAVQDCSFNVEPNSITALIGPNGAGKTTVFNLITGFIRPDSGTVRYKDQSIIGMKPYSIANNGITRTFQLIRLFPKLTVMENLMLAGRHKGESILKSMILPGDVKRQEKKRRKRCMSLLRLVGLEETDHVFKPPSG